MMRPVVAASKFSALALTPTSEPCNPWPSERMVTPSRSTQTDHKPANINPSSASARETRRFQAIPMPEQNDALRFRFQPNAASLLHRDCERIVPYQGLIRAIPLA